MRTKEVIFLDPRFKGITPFYNHIFLATPTMHGEEMEYIRAAIDSGWVTTVGENINSLEEAVSSYVGTKYGVALSCGTAALHMAVKLAGRRLYPRNREGNALEGCRVFCSDMTFDASVNPVVYEGGIPVFIDTEYETWNMDPVALEKAFEIYDDVRIVMLAHLYGVPAKMGEIREICREHGALLIEDAAEALGASYGGAVSQGTTIEGSTDNKDNKTQDSYRHMCGSFGDYAAISFNGNKIVTGSSGGMFLTNSKEDCERVRKWSTQSREAAPWYQHEELGYNYRMSNIIAGVARGNFLHLSEHISRKREIYNRYKKGLADLPVRINPVHDNCHPNYWLTCLLIDKEAMAPQVRSDNTYLYESQSGKSTPSEILDVLAAYNAEGRPIWKPMHMQPIYRSNGFVTIEGSGRAQSNAYIEGESTDVGADVFNRGLCLPSDVKMSPEEQDGVIEIIHRCFS